MNVQVQEDVVVDRIKCCTQDDQDGISTRVSRQQQVVGDPNVGFGRSGGVVPDRPRPG